MSNDYKDPVFKKWLDKLQQESWQLELIISGFAIYGLFQAYEPLGLSMYKAMYNQEVYSTAISGIGFITCSVLIINLIFHVLLRGIWIGALGLRYASGDIDFDHLNYRKKFDRFLRKRIVSFDRYIANLELLCSVIFSISFLLVFYFLGIVMMVFALVGVATLILQDAPDSSAQQIIGILLVLFILFGSFMLIVDFMTQGYLKRNRWLGKIYYPIYRIFGFITLAFLYRPMVYNFLDNKFGKRLLWSLVPIYALIIYLASLDYRESNFIDSDRVSGVSFSDYRNYEDMMLKKEDFTRVASIPSKVIHTPYLKLFVVHSENVENYLVDKNQGLTPDEDIRGLRSGIRFDGRRLNPFLTARRRDSLRREFVNTFNATYRVKIDSLAYEAQFVATTDKNQKLGFETYLPLDSLVDGKHTLKVQRMSIQKGDTTFRTRVTIPFWYFREK